MNIRSLKVDGKNCVFSHIHIVMQEGAGCGAKSWGQEFVHVCLELCDLEQIK